MIHCFTQAPCFNASKFNINLLFADQHNMKSVERTKGIYFFFLFLLISTSCTDSKNKKNTTTPVTSTTTGIDWTTGTTSGEPIGSEVSCSGGIEDGYADIPITDGPPLAPLIIYPITLAGGHEWVPGNSPKSSESYTDNQGISSSWSDPIPDLPQVFATFANDGGFYYRIKVEPQFFPGKNDRYCYYRALAGEAGGGFQDSFPYTKLKFDIYSQKIKRTAVGSSYTYAYIGNKQFLGTTDPIDTETCSEPKYVPAQNSADEVTVLIIEEARSDNWCQYNGTYCPAEKTVRPGSCWRAKLQISTLKTHFFKGYDRTSTMSGN
jgi:hypothetical protein